MSLKEIMKRNEKLYENTSKKYWTSGNDRRLVEWFEKQSILQRLVEIIRVNFKL
jgi:hypothetical protein